MADQKETWRNASQAQAAVLMTDSRGETDHKVIGADRKFEITPEDRTLNQELAFSPAMDIFTNGMLVPVRLVEGSLGAEAIAANPNLKSEAEFRALFKIKNVEKFTAAIAPLSNPTTLQRLIVLAEEEDGSIRQLKAIKARLTEIDPFALDVDVTEVDRIGESEPRSTAMSPR